jgi:hypothetical protein
MNKPYLVDSLKVIVKIVVRLDTKLTNAKIKAIKMAKATVIYLLLVICTYCHKIEHLKKNALNLRRKKLKEK